MFVLLFRVSPLVFLVYVAAAPAFYNFGLKDGFLRLVFSGCFFSDSKLPCTTHVRRSPAPSIGPFGMAVLFRLLFFCPFTMDMFLSEGTRIRLSFSPFPSFCPSFFCAHQSFPRFLFSNVSCTSNLLMHAHVVPHHFPRRPFCFWAPTLSVCFFLFFFYDLFPFRRSSSRVLKPFFLLLCPLILAFFVVPDVILPFFFFPWRFFSFPRIFPQVNFWALFSGFGGEWALDFLSGHSIFWYGFSSVRSFLCSSFFGPYLFFFSFVVIVFVCGPLFYWSISIIP